MPVNFRDIEPAILAFAQRALGGTTETLDDVSAGNIDRVFVARGAAGAVLVKIAVPFVRKLGLSEPLSVSRARSEVAALIANARIAPDLFPKVLDIDSSGTMIALEFLEAHTEWRAQLARSILVPGVGRRVGRHLGEALSAESPENLKQSLHAPPSDGLGNLHMRTFSERVIFSESAANFVEPVLAEGIDSLQRLPVGVAGLRPIVERLAEQTRWLFTTRRDVLTHGDLHTGSVMVDPASGDVKIIDLEFANYGPVSFDIGVLLAHLRIARVRSQMVGDLATAKYIDRQATELWAEFAATVSRSTVSEAWQRRYLEQIICESAWFAAIELLRRTTGQFPVSDLESLAPASRVAAEQLLIRTWVRWALAEPGATFSDLWDGEVREDETDIRAFSPDVEGRTL